MQLVEGHLPDDTPFLVFGRPHTVTASPVIFPALTVPLAVGVVFVVEQRAVGLFGPALLELFECDRFEPLNDIKSRILHVHRKGIEQVFHHLQVVSLTDK